MCGQSFHTKLILKMEQNLQARFLKLGGLLVLAAEKCPAFLKVDLSLGDRRKK